MSLIGISIKRKVTLAMIYIIAIGFGIFSLTQLKVAMTPDIDFPIVLVFTSYSGVSSEDIENLVTRPIEEAVSATENIKKITSNSTNGNSMVMLEFVYGTNMDKAETDVRNALDMIRDYLPSDAEEPFVLALNPSMMPIMMLSMNSKDLGPAELRKLGEDRVEPLLERVEGVASVEISGGFERQINVDLNPVLLASHSLSPQDVAMAIQSSAGLVSSGNIKTFNKEYNLRIYSEYRSLEQIRNLVVKPGTVPLRLMDVATVKDGFKEQTGDVRINGRQGIAIIVSKQSDANTVQAATHVKKELEKIKKVLPQGINFEILFDTSEFTSNSLKNLSNTAIMSLVVVILVVFAFIRSFRGSLIMAISMPISIILTFAVLYLCDLTLNVISMAGLALAIGMLVDNSIVVLESIFRYRSLGHKSVEASEEGASEMSTAIIASTLTTLSVFVPVLFVPGITGQLFKEMVLTVTFSLSVSLLVALTLVPMMASVFLKERLDSKKSKKVNKPNALKMLTDKYQKLLHWSLYHKKYVLLITILMLVFSCCLVPFLGGEFMPETDQGRINFTIESATGVPLTSLRETVIKVEKILKEDVPEIVTATFRFGVQQGFNPGGSSGNTINTTLRLLPQNERKRSQKEIEVALRKKLDEIPGISYRFEGGSMMSSSGERAIEIKVVGDDLTRAKAIADDLKARMEKVEGLVDVSVNVNDYIPQLDVHLKQDVLNDLRLTNIQVASIVSTAIQGKTVSKYREKGDEYNIYVQLDKKYRQDRDALGNLLIPIPAGGTVPLRQIADIRETQGPVTIYRENQERYVSVGCNLAGIDLRTAVKKVEQIQSEIAVPSDLMLIMGGTAEDQQEAYFFLIIAVLVAALLVYMVMASQFESLVDPFIIMFTVPLSIIGVFIFMFITKTPISVMSLIGIVILVGIAVNNGIVLVDYINQLRARGTGLYEAAEESGITRIRPVLMTALTTIIGMIPLALKLGDGSETWAPLAVSVIGGMAATTLLTLVVIPCLYIIFEEWGEKIKSRLFGIKKA
jgi:HAE1 family hydrophobic/amphiphilic exporter-1